LPEHISRKELKTDKIHDVIEHSAEAVYSHKRLTLNVLLVMLIGALAYGGWTIYNDRQTAAASIELDKAMKSYTGRISGTPDSGDLAEVTYKDEAARATDAERRFRTVADKYPHTTPGKLARYYTALCLEDLEHHNQALEDLKKLSSGSDKALASLAQYQSAGV
jgi:predicted negative regulator of RcsB-dependent stress response